MSRYFAGLHPTSSRRKSGRRSVRTFTSSLVALSCYWKSVSSLAPAPAFSVSGQRYLYVPAPTNTLTAAASPPPLLIIPGTAQSIELWEQHVPFLSKTRAVVICEPLGVGLQVPKDMDMSIASQAETLRRTLDEINDDSLSCALDVAGFSLGGRIALALACLDPTKINRIHLTGVSLQRSDWGALQIASWKDLLKHGQDLRPFAWSALLASYSPEFLMKQKDRLPQWIEGVCQRHTLEGLRQLVQETHNEDDSHWSVAAMAERLPPGLVGRLCVGESDQLAPVDEAKSLAEVLQWPTPTIIQQAAHVPPIENPRAWRRDLETFIQ